VGYADVKTIDSAIVPIIDISGLISRSPESLRKVAGEIRNAAETVGFFYVKNHGIPQELVDEAFSIAQRFFALPLAEKNELQVNKIHRGFIRTGEAKMYDDAKADLKESFVWGLDVGEDDPDYQAGRPLIGPNQWPAKVPEMRQVLMAYFDACNQLGWALFKAFATSLDIPADYFVKTISKPMTRCSIIYYPPQPEAMGKDQFGVAPHTDFGCLTLLNQDSVGGLQVRDNNGDWVTAPPVEGTLVVNVGDLMARWTNDRFASTPHRVVNASGRERYSVAVFVDPDFETDMTPVTQDGEMFKYDPTTCGDYLVWRLGKAFAYRNKN
jgi:isopenicillin N synthase-like dioxygenase